MNKANLIRVSRVSLIGGISGGIGTLTVLFLSRVFPTHSLIVDFLWNGFTFVIVGIGVAISYNITMPQLRNNRRTLFLCAIICGFIAGLFYNFGVFTFLSIIIFSFFFAFLTKLLKLSRPLRFFMGGTLGGLNGFLLASLFIMWWDHVKSLTPFSTVSAMFYTAIIAYFMNFGLLIPLMQIEDKKGEQTKRRDKPA